MENSTNYEKNPFDKLLQESEKDREIARLNEKYKHRSYRDRNKWKYNASKLGILIFQSGSIATASTFVFSYFLFYLLGAPYPLMIAGMITAIVLIGIEITLGLSLIKLLEGYFRNSKIDYGLLVFLIAIISFSNFCSYSGGFDMPKKVMAKPIKETPLPPDLAKIEQRYKLNAENARIAAKEYKESRSYLGKLRHGKESQAYVDLQNQSIAFESKMNDEIKAAKDSYESQKISAELNYQSAVDQWEINSESKGSGLAGIAIICSFLTVLCYIYKEKYEDAVYREHKKAKESATHIPATNTTVYRKPTQAQRNLSTKPRTQPKTQTPTQVSEHKHNPANTGATHVEYSTHIPTEHNLSSTQTQSAEEVHATDYANTNSQIGATQIGKALKIHHAGTDKKHNHKDCYFTQSQVKAKIRTYATRVNGAYRNQQNKPSESNKRVLANNEKWLKYWENRVLEFE